MSDHVEQQIKYFRALEVAMRTGRRDIARIVEELERDDVRRYVDQEMADEEAEEGEGHDASATGGAE